MLSGLANAIATITFSDAKNEGLCSLLLMVLTRLEADQVVVGVGLGS